MTKKMLISTLVLSGVVAAVATDGTFWGNTFGLTEHWLYRVKPTSDGTASIDPSVTTVAVNGSEQVRNLVFPGRGLDGIDKVRSVSFTGTGSLTFTGSTTLDFDCWFTNTLTAASSSVAVTFNGPVVGVSSGNTLSLDGKLTKSFSSLSGAGTVSLREGSTKFTGTAMVFPGAVSLDGGSLTYTTTANSTGSVGSLVWTRPTHIFLDTAAGRSANLTMGALGARTQGLPLILRAGFAAYASERQIGREDKVFVTDTSTIPMRDGIVDPVILSYISDTDNWAWKRADFLSYDSTNGFKVYRPVKTLDTAGTDELALVGSAYTVSANKQVRGIVCEATAGQRNCQHLTVAQGVTLKIGDGVRPAGILLNSDYTQASFGSANMNINGPGTIDFGGSEGFLISGNGHGNTSFNIGTTITGSNGVTFMDAVGTAQTCINNVAAAWSGPTRIVGTAFTLGNADRLPSGGDVYVYGDSTGQGGSVEFTAALTLNQKFHLCGYGPNTSNLRPYGMFNINNGNKAITFTGLIDLMGDTDVNAVGSSGEFHYKCPITGSGFYRMYNGYHGFEAGSSASFAGGFRLSNGARLVSTGSCLDNLGAFTVDAGCTATFQHATNGVTFADMVKSEGLFNAVTGTYSFAEDAQFTQFSAQGGATVKIGSKLTIGADSAGLTDSGSTFGAMSGATAQLVLGGTGDTGLSANIADGDGTLDVVKTGAGSLTLGGTLAYTGKTVVEEGTLTFAKSILDDPGISWWIDATDASKHTTNGNGRVTEIRSKVGDVKFLPADSSNGPTATNTLDGKRVFTFDRLANNTRIMTDRATCQRTVFIVDMPREHHAVMGIYGDYGDRGVRSGYLEGNEKDWNWGKAGYINGLRANGSSWSDTVAYVVGEPQVLTLRQGPDHYEVNPPYVSNYQAYLGGYFYTSPTDHRDFDGDIAEAIAFNRVLTDEECLEVEKYLADRWGVTLSRQPSGTYVGSRPSASTDLEIAYGATLDLAGRDLTVASLSGAGSIVNTGSTPAKLIVAGACTFRGTVGVGATLKGAGALELAVAAGGGLELVAGNTVLGRNCFTPMTNSLALWLDASRPETITTNVSGRVTEWRSLAGRKSGAVSGVGRTSSLQAGPVYGTDADGKPACRFDATNYLARVGMAPRTVIVATKLRGLAGSYTTIWGLHQKDSEWRTGNGDDTFYRNGLDTGVMTIERQDGTSSLKMVSDERFISVARFVDGVFPSYVNDPHFIDGPDAANCVGFGLGANFNSGVLQDVNEVLVYERYLSDGELVPILEYLRDKWFRSAGATVGRQPGAVLADGASLGMAGGSVDLSAFGPVSVASLANNGGGSITGDLTLTGNFLVDALDGTSLQPLAVNGTLTLGAGATATVTGFENLTENVSHPALTATTLSGAFQSVDWGGNGAGWSAYTKPGTWGIIRNQGTIMLFR